MQLLSTRLRLASFLVASPLLTGGVAVSAQSLQPVLLSGDSVPGLSGTISNVFDIFVTDDGQWTARTVISTGTGQIEAVLLNGAPVLITGDPLFDPPGLAVVSFDEVGVTPGGTLWWIISTDAADSEANEILYRDLNPIAQEGAAVFDPNQNQGTIWTGFQGFDFSDDGDLLVAGTVDAPQVTGTLNDVLVRQSFGANGVLIDEETLLLEGDPLPGTNLLVKLIGTNMAGFDVAHSDEHWIAYVTNSGGSSGNEMVMVDGLVVAQEGAAGPLTGSTWKKLSGNAVDITNAGDYAFRGEYEDSAGVRFKSILVNLQPVYTNGDSSPSLSPFAFASFGSNTPVHLSENGDLIFLGKTDNPDATQDQGYFLNDRFLVHEGVTPVGAETISKLVTVTNGLAASPSGRYVICQGTLTNSQLVVLLLDLGLVQAMTSSTVASASLAHTGGLSVPGEALELQMDGEQDLGVTPVLLISSAPVAGWLSTGTGLSTAFGELLVDLSPGNPVLILSGPPSDFSPADFSIDIPNDLGLVDQDFFAQGFFWDIGDMSPQEDFRLTNGLQICIGE